MNLLDKVKPCHQYRGGWGGQPIFRVLGPILLLEAGPSHPPALEVHLSILSLPLSDLSEPWLSNSIWLHSAPALLPAAASALGVTTGLWSIQLTCNFPNNCSCNVQFPWSSTACSQCSPTVTRATTCERPRLPSPGPKRHRIRWALS